MLQGALSCILCNGRIFSRSEMVMVAEENKRKAVLKKRIKRLAVHQMLLERMPVAEVVVWSKGRC